MTECSILLEACYPAKNIFRSYFISVYYDLFGSLKVDVVYGRIGSKGKCSTFLMDQLHDAKSFVVLLLKKRETALQRIGVSYRLKHYAGYWELHEALFLFRQIPLFDPLSDQDKNKKNIPAKEIIKEGEGLFG